MGHKKKHQDEHHQDGDDELNPVNLSSGSAPENQVLLTDGDGGFIYGGAPPGTGGEYTLQLGFVSSTINRSGIYVVGIYNYLGAQTLFNDRPSRRAMIPTSGKITKVSIMSIIAGSKPSSDPITVNIRNWTEEEDQLVTDALVWSSGALLGDSRIDQYTLDEALEVSAGDQIQLRLLTPNWTTHPARQVYMTAVVTVEVD